MQAAYFTSSGFELRDVPIPACEPGMVLVQQAGIGICSSETGRYKGGAGPEDVLMGHEGAGVVVAVGAGVNNCAVGDAVTLLGGTFSEYAVVGQENLVTLPDAVEALWSLGEPIACCVHAMQRCRLQGGEQVVIVGCGFMGLICLQLAKAFGAGRIVAIDPIAWRRDKAMEAGADEAFAPDDARVAEHKQKYGSMDGAYDVVIEATGVQAGVELSGYLVRQHGLLNLVGHHYSKGGRRDIFLNQWNVKAIDVVNGHVRRQDEKVAAMEYGMRLLAAGELDTKSLISCYPLSEVQQAFDDVLHNKAGLFKPVLIPDKML